MAQSRQAIQARISSVSSTKKITKAMQLIASSKLTRQRQIMEENRIYAQGLQELFTMVLRSAGDDSMYLNENQGKPSFIFVITSDMILFRKLILYHTIHICVIATTKSHITCDHKDKAWLSLILIQIH